MTCLSLAAAFAVLLGSFGYARHRAIERAVGQPHRPGLAQRLPVRRRRGPHRCNPAGGPGPARRCGPDGHPAFFLTAAASLIWVFAADLALIRLGAVRSRRWLIAAPLAFILACFVLLVLPFAWWRGEPGLFLAGPAAVALAADSAAAGLLWWSYLAPDQREAARVFD
jgi:hypothetical protein